ncbi:MAG: hypothetical protein R3245_10635, partial [Kiloniellales bacterium]|nr:hypothetical protein [Kiloniellales bacterium]
DGDPDRQRVRRHDPRDADPFGAQLLSRDAASEAEEVLRENAIVSVVLAAGVGLVVGYLIGRSSD